MDEICVAVADVQTAGRGRLDRAWQADRGRALLASAGFRPPSLAAGHAWRLPATASLAMLEAARSLLAEGADHLALKWPNDIVSIHEGRLRKVAGVLSSGVLQSSVSGRDRGMLESGAQGMDAGDAQMASVVVGIGINVTWPQGAFPAELAGTMSSLSEANDGQPVARELLLSTWLARLEARYDALVRGRFDGPSWMAEQVTTGADVEVDTGNGRVAGLATGFDAERGALLLEVGESGATVAIAAGDVVRCRLATVREGERGNT